MICKQCKTAVPDGAKTCPVCGVAVKKANGVRGAMLATLALIAVAGALYFYFSRTGPTEPPDITPDPNAPEITMAATPTPTLLAPTPTASIVPTPGADETTEPDEPGETEEVTETDPAFLELMAWAQAAEEYIAENPDNTFVSVNGGLYDRTAGRFVIAADLGFTGQLFVNPIILYVLTEDFAVLDEALAAGETTGLTVYAAAEVQAGVAVAWNQGYAVVYREEYNGLLRVYDTKHGDIKYAAGTPLAGDLLLLAASYTFSEQGYNPRYIKADDKYAVAVLSEAGSQELKGYVFENGDWGWGVVLSELEQAENLAAYVNNRFPDLNLALLPPYEITQAQAALYTDSELAALEAALRAGDEPILAEDAVITYLSAASGWGYVVAEGSRYLLELDGSEIRLAAVETWEDAASVLESGGLAGAAFIIMQW